MARKSWLLLVVIALLLAACGGQGSSPTGATASPSPATSGTASLGNAANGETLFNQATVGKDNVPGCKTCHSIVKDQKIVGPSLAGIASDAEEAPGEDGYKGTAKTAAEWLREAIVSPDVDVPEGYGANVMPQNFKDELSAGQINDLVAYLLTLK